ncbi:hypothetical protein SAMD00023353_2801510 [Rosellinia necatrix]|uniref:Uncharacterized protein n=1 Tax=Rosellinia necatrix TaxID=77044 RepID=A0A1W2TI33_ROSNE|nr:hypothetical protein SAMD00023353_2801510 [Rosellinia necatrix]
MGAYIAAARDKTTHDRRTDRIAWFHLPADPGTPAYISRDITGRLLASNRTSIQLDVEAIRSWHRRCYLNYPKYRITLPGSETLDDTEGELQLPNGEMHHPIVSVLQDTYSDDAIHRCLRDIAANLGANYLTVAVTRTHNNGGLFGEFKKKDLAGVTRLLDRDRDGLQKEYSYLQCTGGRMPSARAICSGGLGCETGNRKSLTGDDVKFIGDDEDGEEWDTAEKPGLPGRALGSRAGEYGRAVAARQDGGQGTTRHQSSTPAAPPSPRRPVTLPWASMGSTIRATAGDGRRYGLRRREMWRPGSRRPGTVAGWGVWVGLGRTPPDLQTDAAASMGGEGHLVFPSRHGVWAKERVHRGWLTPGAGSARASRLAKVLYLRRVQRPPPGFAPKRGGGGECYERVGIGRLFGDEVDVRHAVTDKSRMWLV